MPHGKCTIVLFPDNALLKVKAFFVHFIAVFDVGQNAQLVVVPNRLRFVVEEFQRRLEQALRSKKNLATSNIIMDPFHARAVSLHYLILTGQLNLF